MTFFITVTFLHEFFTLQNSYMLACCFNRIKAMPKREQGGTVRIFRTKESGEWFIIALMPYTVPLFRPNETNYHAR